MYLQCVLWYRYNIIIWSSCGVIIIRLILTFFKKNIYHLVFVFLTYSGEALSSHNIVNKLYAIACKASQETALGHGGHAETN